MLQAPGRVQFTRRICFRTSAVTFATLLMLVSLAIPAAAQNFIRGDVYADGVIDDYDICAFNCYLYGGTTCAITGTPCADVLPMCMLAADVNDDGGPIDGTDLFYLVSYLMMGGSPPPPPFPDCGPDPTDPQPGEDCCGGGSVCGDADGSSEVDIDDVVYLIAYIFSSGPPPNPLSTGEADCSGEIDIDDVVYLISYIFAGGSPPCDPDDNGSPDC